MRSGFVVCRTAIGSARQNTTARIMVKTGHAERTANEPRDPSLHRVILNQVDEINPRIRTFRLAVPETVGAIRFLPGQWLDVFVPSIDKPGGFTITSPPSRAQKSTSPSSTDATADSAAEGPYLELAVQDSPDNAVARWLWQPAQSILSSELRVRVGGSFVWPPPGVMPMTLRKLVFVAGGVGVNPLMSIVSHLAERPNPRYNVQFLYSTRDPGDGERDAAKLLFLERLAGIFSHGKVRGDLKLFLTPGLGSDDDDGDGDGSVQAAAQAEDIEGTVEGLDLKFERRRITTDDVAAAIGNDKRFAAVYVCGVPTMTDKFVEKLTSPEGVGLEPHRVLCEKWW